LGRDVAATLDTDLVRPLRTKLSVGLPPVVASIRQALQLIGNLDHVSRGTLHWRLALNILEYAQMRNEPETIELATDAVENALATDGWLAR
jgi:hypothetical protein